MLKIRGARTHNLKNIDLDIPRNELVVLTGLSGSGKSSLAFDTLYAEGQRRYVESLSAYARQFLSVMDKPDVDHIGGLSPAIAIEQKTTSHNPRSTVGTVTEIYDYMRLLFARLGVPHCPEHQIGLKSQTPEQSVDKLLQDHPDTRVMMLAPLVSEKKGSHEQIFAKLRKDGYIKVVLNAQVYDLDDLPEIDPKVKNTLQVVIDRLTLKVENRSRLLSSLEVAVRLGSGSFQVAYLDETRNIERFELICLEQVCPKCGFSAPKLEPRDFSFNSPKGYCQSCDGLGFEYQISAQKIIFKELTLSQGALWGFEKNHPYYHGILSIVCKTVGIPMDVPWEELSVDHQEFLIEPAPEEYIQIIKPRSRFNRVPKKITWIGALALLQQRYKHNEQEHTKEQLKAVAQYLPCRTCQGSRLNPTATHVRVHDWSISKITSLSTSKARDVLRKMQFSPQEQTVASQVITEIVQRLGFLCDVGLDYLTLARSADTLSGGEAQRIRLASQIGSQLVGVMYVLDEPSIGLHQCDNDKLLKTLRSLVNLGNTVIVVEHDMDAMNEADFLIDIGPGAGKHGGQIIAKGDVKNIIDNPQSLTGDYLSGRKKITRSSSLIKHHEKFIEINSAYENNLKNVHVKIPLGLLTCVTGVSGSGKSTLINKILYPYLAHKLNRASLDKKLLVESITGISSLDKVVAINQAPIGRTPRSNPATYIGLLTPIRELFAQTPKARAEGFKPGRFSFNIPGGRCSACEGDGLIKVEMHFLSDVYVKCEACQGRRYNEKTLAIDYRGKNIADVLEMTVDEAAVFFEAHPSLMKKLALLQRVGLGYIHLGQNATTLSGGEAQRIKLAKELSRKDHGKTFYILDEPTTGLHFVDIQKLIDILFDLRDKGNTICLIEHNIDVINCADWVIDIGPKGGENGGEILVQGTLEDLKKCQDSATAKYIEIQ